jgi:hypothetical protein
MDLAVLGELVVTGDPRTQPKQTSGLDHEAYCIVPVMGPLKTPLSPSDSPNASLPESDKLKASSLNIHPMSNGSYDLIQCTVILNPSDKSKWFSTYDHTERTPLLLMREIDQ